jgi:hypothetical protein
MDQRPLPPVPVRRRGKVFGMAHRCGTEEAVGGEKGLNCATRRKEVSGKATAGQEERTKENSECGSQGYIVDESALRSVHSKRVLRDSLLRF